jgi:hypothetical protein
MKKIAVLFIWSSLLIIFDSCSVQNQLSSEKRLKFSLLTGGNIGGITENTDMSVVPGVKVPEEATVDAFSGATRIGFNVGIRANMPLKRNEIETGADYMYNHQTFTYIDAGNKYIGVRELHVSQLMLPVAYNLGLFKKQMPEEELQVKVGLIGQVNFISGTGTGILPDYSVIPFSTGPTLGVSVLPFHFDNGNKLGVYFDIYRGTQIYKDFYNQPSYEMPGSSFIKFGLKYQFH